VALILPINRSSEIMAYVSEVTLFLNDLIEKNPDLQAERMANRADYWEAGTLDLQRQAEHDSARLPNKPYAYQSK
jgi:hypothetical protein